LTILILCRYSRLGASSRLRFYQFIPRLEEAGITCIIHPLLNDSYLHEFYGKKGISKRNLLGRYVSMMRTLGGAPRFDLVLIEKEIFPFLPPFAEWWLNLRHIPYIVDYDDAIFHNYDLHPNGFVRALLGRKIATVMRRAVSAVCGNAYLGEYARLAGARRITLIPTVIDTDKYVPRVGRPEGPVIIGWIGSPSSLKYLRSLLPLLRGLVDTYGVRVHIVGAKEGIGLGKGESVLEWSEDTEADLIAGFDIGIMPLEDSPWERGKCGYKLIQYMGCGLPVVGSPVGVNGDIIREGINGYKPGNAAAWKTALEALIGDASLRRRMGDKGRELVLERYSLDVGAKQWLEEIQIQKR
jgi:glycosyltransferase involved in cell wall biosynthesis